MSVLDVFMCPEGIIGLFMFILWQSLFLGLIRKKLMIYKKHLEEMEELLDWTEELLDKAIETNEKSVDLLGESVRMLNEDVFPEFEAVGKID